MELFIFVFLLIVLLVYFVILYVRLSRCKKDYDKKFQESRAHMIQLEKMASLGTLSAGIAHEINNPLTFLITNLDLICHYTKDIGALQDVDNREKKIADIILSVQEGLDGANRIKRIVQDLLAFSHSSQGKLVNVDVNELLDVTVRILWNEIKYKVDVTRDYRATTKIWIDSNQISQVFLNLIINASHAIKSNVSSDRGTISLATSEDEDNIFIIVSDTGCGIPEKNLQNIFEPFFTTSGGTGLGLYVSQKIINDHGGVMIASNGKNSGAILTVKLPKKPLKPI
jgi:two-component system NtrC family sensor kinase